LSASKRIALLNARAELAGHIESTIKSVTTNYTNQRTIGDRQEFAERFDQEARAIVNQKLNDVSIIGERVFRENNGTHVYYIALEMSKDAILQALNERIAGNERLRLDYDQQQFRRLFDEEMRKTERR
jgi:DNA-binding transcriptional regulator YbjK